MASDYLFLCQPFSAMSVTSVFELFKLRNAIFIVEQNCVYQDIDQLDLEAHHIVMCDQNKVIGCSRFFINQEDQLQIGRLALDRAYRQQALGKQLFQYTLTQSQSIFPEKTLMLSSQKHLTAFYQQFGFNPIGDEFLEDNIPHQHMIKKQ